MFTGIIRLRGSVVSARPLANRAIRLAIRPDAPGFPIKPALGDSIAVDGCCLTVATPAGPDGTLEFDVIPETQNKTTLGRLGGGDDVHLEQAASASTLLDGHIVQGHVDGRAAIISVFSFGEWRIRLAPPQPLLQYIIPKGSVTLAGVSLTVADVRPDEGWFEVALIPITMDLTKLASLQAGDDVNLECDAMAKTVVHWLTHFAGRIPPTPIPAPATDR